MKLLTRRQVEDRLVELYDAQPVGCDHLPYTIEFETMHRAVALSTELSMDRHDTWETFLYLRKAGRLRPKEKARKADVLDRGPGLLG
jgi:hypothetical protein